VERDFLEGALGKFYGALQPLLILMFAGMALGVAASCAWKRVSGKVWSETARFTSDGASTKGEKIDHAVVFEKQ
jgi:hypothetical protein